ncbi:Dabb family protein [Bordetella sp. LUAb4]|uniref:Dabb family protein n=1 Tax=Bordetella sp. LUAb4 TaxID=2843195 RepID=UPI001E3CF943|nr:Dabb family protein [Bordetella sp. LUAb4]
MYDMRRRLLQGGAGALLGRLSITAIPASLTTLTAIAGEAMTARPPEDVFTSESYQPGLLLHVVLFKYKPEVTAEQKREVQRRFLALRDSKRPGAESPYILSITSGYQSSMEGVGLDFEQGFTVTFKSAGDRNYYVGKPIVNDPAHFDPHHDEFKAYVGPLLAPQAGVLVFDYPVDAPA